MRSQRQEEKGRKSPRKIPQHLKIICLLEVSWLQYHEDVNGTDCTLRWKWCSRSAATGTVGLGPANPRPLCTSSSSPVKGKTQECDLSGPPTWYSGPWDSWPFFHHCGSSMAVRGWTIALCARLFICLLCFMEGRLLIGGALLKALVSKEKWCGVMQCLGSCIPHPPACPSILLIRVHTGWHLEYWLLFWPLFIDILSLLKSFLEQIKG